jgi:S1-C subfamily serine protease
MVTGNVINRTFHIQYGENIATAFLIDIDHRQYLITAKHVVPNIPAEAVISILHNEKWCPVSVKLVGHAPGDADISVLALPFRISGADLTLPARAAGLTLGQDVYFLGFPFGLFGKMAKGNNDYPLPFVKKAVVSCFEHHEDYGLHRVFLDGHNNPGFSGGPVVFFAADTNEFKVAAVISGYRPDRQHLFQGATKLEGYTTQENTGIILSYGIGYAVKLAQQNPIGAVHQAPL